MHKAGLKKEVHATLVLAWPIMGAQMANFSMMTVDTIMVGQLGPESLAAMAMAISFWHLGFVFCIGLLQAVSPMVAEAQAAQRWDELGPLLRHGLRIALGISILIVLSLLLAPQAFTLLRQPSEIIPMGMGYLHAFAWGIPAQIAFIAIRQFTEGTGDSRPSLFIVLAGVALNILANYALIFGNFGFPALGLRGAAYATSIVSWWMLLLALLYVTFSRRHRKYGLWKGPYRTDWKLIYSILRFGIPLSFATLNEVGFFASMTFMMGMIGTLPLAGHQIALNVAAVVFMLPMGLSMATAIRVGYARGRRDLQGARLAVWASCIVSIAVSTVSAFCFLFFSETIAGWYTNDLRLIGMASTLLIVGAAFQLFDGLQVVGIGALRGMKNSRLPLINTTIAFWIIAFPVAVILTFPLGWGGKGVWTSMVVGLGIASILHLRHFHQISRSQTRSESGDTELRKASA